MSEITVNLGTVQVAKGEEGGIEGVVLKQQMAQFGADERDVAEGFCEGLAEKHVGHCETEADGWWIGPANEQGEAIAIWIED